MIIKKIVLDNIRSFEHEEIQFAEGATLLLGDIGSGKTSVLLGIEFGLFGLQPGQRGSILLRTGLEWGGVKLTIEVEGKEYLIERTLKRAKTVSQDYAAITIDGQKEEMSVTELKSKVLDILNYPSELSKKQNILYKFTVYTPQEEMKQIVLEDSETRLNTLRHVFGIDKYKRIIENTNMIRIKIREDKRLFEGVTMSLDSDKKILESKNSELKEMENKIFTLSEDLLLKIEIRKEKEKEKEEISKEMEKKVYLKSKIGQAQGLLHSKMEIFTNNEKLIQSAKKELQDFEILNFNPLELQEVEDEILKKKKLKDKINLMYIENNSQIASINSKIKSCEELEKKMQNLEVCPTCLQNVDSIYRANVLNKNHNEIFRGKNTLEELDLEKKSFQEKISELDVSISLHERKATDLKIQKMKLDGIKEREIKSKELEKQNHGIESDIELLKKQIDSIKEDLLSLLKYDNINEEKSKELAVALRDERISEIKLAELKKEIEMSKKTINELEERISKIEEVKEKLEYLTELELWLNKKFMPLVSFVERNVMVNLKHEFSKLFSDWFSTLVPEGLSVRLSNDFTPIIEQKDFEIDYAYLSGGERTAIALAYRLALTQTINSLMSKVKTKDILILDEPTDGFSSQQLDKMREVLDQLKVRQLVIVSHEQKIEGFVENVIKFKKEYGVSRKN